MNEDGDSKTYPGKDSAEEFARGSVEELGEEDILPEDDTETPEDEGLEEVSEEDLDQDIEKKRKAESRTREQLARTMERARSVLHSVLGSAKTDLPKGIEESLSKAVSSFKGKDFRSLLRTFESKIRTYSSQNAFSSWARDQANHIVSFKNWAEVESPQAMGQKLAQMAIAFNVVANPKILGGKPISSKPKTPQELGDRTQEAYSHYSKLDPTLIEHAASQIEEELKGLEEGSPRAQELNAILTGIALANIVKTGKSVAGRPEPSAGAVALVKKMSDLGQVDLLFRPVEDFFATDSRDDIKRALSLLEPKELIEVTMGGDSDHPYRALGDKLLKGEIPEPFDAGVREFLEEEFMLSMSWKDRAFRDALESTGRKVDAETRGRELGAAIKVPAPEIEDFLDAVDKVAAEEPLSREEDVAIRNYDASKGASLLRGSAKQFVKWVSQAFSKPIQGSALPVMKKFVETGDKEWLTRPAVPHPDRPPVAKKASLHFSTYRSQGNRRITDSIPPRKIMAKKIEKKAALIVTDLMDRVANLLEYNRASLGVPSHVVKDLAGRLDAVSDHINRRSGTLKQVQSRTAQINSSPYDFDENFTETDLAPGNFDPSEIGEMYDGAFLRDEDEPYVDCIGEQDEFYQLGRVQENGLFSNAKTAARRRR